jgi:hypothetical protein
MLLPCAAALAGPVYKWVDEKGVVHYSDQPHPKGEKVEVSDAQTYSGREASDGVRQNTASAGVPPQQGSAYQVCEISSPANDEVLMNVTSMSGAVRLQPQLTPGHKISVVLDGQPATAATSNGMFSISPIARGMHTVSISVQDASGKELCRSAAITFHVRQPSRQAPNPANRPRF